MIVTLHLSVYEGIPIGWPFRSRSYLREFTTPQAPDEGSSIVLFSLGNDPSDGVTNEVYRKVLGWDGSIHCWLKSVWIDPPETPQIDSVWWDRNTTWFSDRELADFEHEILEHGWVQENV